MSAVELRVANTGRGIATVVRGSMFESFLRTKHPAGLGMGLTVARPARRNAGGDLTLQDRSGGGTVTLLLHPGPRPKRRSQGACSPSAKKVGGCPRPSTARCSTIIKACICTKFSSHVFDR